MLPFDPRPAFLYFGLIPGQEISNQNALCSSSSHLFIWFCSLEAVLVTFLLLWKMPETLNLRILFQLIIEEVLVMVTQIHSLGVWGETGHHVSGHTGMGRESHLMTARKQSKRGGGAWIPVSPSKACLNGRFTQLGLTSWWFHHLLIPHTGDQTLNMPQGHIWDPMGHSDGQW